MHPEQAFVVSLSEEGVSCRRPNGKVEAVAWSELQAVLIETNAEGPFAPDVFWILVGRQRGALLRRGPLAKKSY